MPSQGVFSFPPFRLDAGNQELRRRSRRVALRPKTFDFLMYLVRHSGRLVTKKELLENVWPDAVVSDELLRGYVRELRRLLGDDAKKPRYIETVAARGYRFLAPVEEEVSPASAASVPPPVKIGHRNKDELRVGILHSLTGNMAWTERPVVDATCLAIEEINERGGILGRRIRHVVADGESDEAAFARGAERLIREERVSALFGCWTSASRKAVLPILEKRDHLLIYPTQYEGMEISPNVFYTGAAPNQQILPAVGWAFGFLRKRRFFLVGWNSVYSRATNAILADEIAALGGEVVGEEYLLPDSIEAARVVRSVVRRKPDVIFNSLVGDTNLFYTRLLRAAGVSPERIPTVYLSVGEIELVSLTARETVGDYAAWNYFQSLDRPENRAFVERFRSHYGRERVTADPMEAGYLGVHLWARAAEAAGTGETAEVRRALPGRAFEAPGGPVRIDAENHHTWKTVRLGRIVEGGQFEVVLSSENPIRPEPHPPSRSPAEWDRFLAGLFEEWNGHWTKPRS